MQLTDKKVADKFYVVQVSWDKSFFKFFDLKEAEAEMMRLAKMHKWNEVFIYETKKSFINSEILSLYE